MTNPTKMPANAMPEKSGFWFAALLSSGDTGKEAENRETRDSEHDDKHESVLGLFSNQAVVYCMDGLRMDCRVYPFGC